MKDIIMETDDYSFSRPYIGPGEAVLWKGKPGKGHIVTGQDAFMIPFSILWCGFAIFWETTAIASGAPFFFWLWGIPFVCMGLYLVFGRFLWAAHMRKRTAYVITNRKIIRLRRNKIDMLEGRNMPAMRMSANKDGSGTIRFGEEILVRRRYSMNVNGSYTAQPAFTLENVPDVARVVQIIEKMER